MQQQGLHVHKLQLAQKGWLKPSEVMKILQNHELFEVSHTLPVQPPSGSQFLFNRRVNRNFRKDGHQWRKNKTGRVVGEAHERLSVNDVPVLNCYYAHGDKNPAFQRRIYWMLDPAYEHIVLVHYREITEHMGTQSGSPTLPWAHVGDSRMDDIYMELDVLECAVDGSKKPSNLKFSFLQFITKQFSDELKIGHGGCGLVYKGILPNGVIAVKKLLNNHTIDDKMFHQEVTSLMMVTHKNTVRLVGYCSHTEEKAIEMAGKIFMAEIRERLLCFEYVTNGSLENHITDELRGLEWDTRYQIIEGICQGLHHLHKEKHIIHMDLKPANILLDDKMVPKISDFGLSRLDEKSHTMSAERVLTLGYCAPEYLQHGKRSAKSDIYSLGVIITELVTGSRGNPCITKVLRRWKHRWNKSATDTQLLLKQVSTCLDLALRCMHTNPTDRPNIWDIIRDLNKMDNADMHNSDDTECLKLENMLDIEPLEMHFPFELNKHIPGSIELTNDTDDYFAFRMSSISLRPYFIHPFKGIVPPRSKCSVTIMLQPQERVPPQFPCKDEFSVQSTRVDVSLTALDISEMFNEELGKVVDEVTVKVVLESASPPVLEVPAGGGAAAKHGNDTEEVEGRPFKMLKT